MGNFIPNTQILPHYGGAFTVTYTLAPQELAVESWEIQFPEGYNNEFDVQMNVATKTGCTFTVYVSENEETINKVYKFFLICHYLADDDGLSFLPRMLEYTFTVEYDPNKVLTPIWKDVFYRNGSTDTLEYTIYDDADNIIYNGKTIAEPNGKGIVFNVNRVCHNYLDSHLPNGIKEGVNYVYNYARLFTLTGQDDTQIARYRFFNSYIYGNDSAKTFISDPIKRKVSNNRISIDVDRRQYAIVSAFSKTNDKITLYQTYETDRSLINKGYAIDNNAMLVCINRDLYDSLAIPLIVYTTSKSGNGVFEINIVDTCYDYCLYYVNAYGGWDSLLVKGNVKKSDAITPQYYKQSFNNTTTEFERTKYANLITTSYELNTDWFNDDEQSRLHHLIESTEVYLHDLKDDIIMPVNITNSSCEYKTFTNNGKKKWNNKINVEVAQTKIRR